MSRESHFRCRRVCHGVDRGRDGVVPGGVVDGSVMEWIGEGVVPVRTQRAMKSFIPSSIRLLNH